jgi:hypothetical protein
MLAISWPDQGINVSTLLKAQRDSSHSRIEGFFRHEAERVCPGDFAFSIAFRFISRSTVVYRLVVLTLA